MSLTCLRGRGFAFAAAVVLGLLPPTTAPLAAAQWNAPADAELQRVLDERIAGDGSTGLVLGIVESGEPRIVAAGRCAGADSAVPDGDTVFEIGSVSKVLTTTLLAEMVGRGEVALDDPVQKFLPERVRLPSLNGHAITLLDLATATSGLPRMPDGEPSDPANPYADYTVEQMYACLSGLTLPREPGAAYEYSNLGMGLLGHVLGLRAGMSYEALVTERILAPLGMQDTCVVLTPELQARLAVGHGADLEPTSNWDIPTLAGAGAWRSTAKDMLKFVAACVAPPDGSLGDAIKACVEPRRPTGNPGLSIGLGWHVIDRADSRIVWHNGETGGYHSFTGFDPATGANVLVLSNCSTEIDDIGLHVLDSNIRLRPLPPPREQVAVNGDVLDTYVGDYQLAPGFFLGITRAGDALFCQATGQARFRIYPVSQTRFFVKAFEADIGFIQDEAGTVTGLILYQNGRESPGQKIR